MKLVDILAQELKVWPSGCEIIDQDSDRACYADYSDRLVLSATSRADDFADGKVTRAEWQAAVEALKAPAIDWDNGPADATHYDTGKDRAASFMKLERGHWFFWPPAASAPSWQDDGGAEQFDRAHYIVRPAPDWTGEGLPPVGIDVEIHNKSGRGVVEGAEGFIGTICKVLATFVNMNGYEMVSVEDSAGFCMCFRADMCGPVRTPEQIAAEEREKGITEMRRQWSLGGEWDKFVALWDAGYRKQVTP